MGIQFIAGQLDGIQRGCTGSVQRIGSSAQTEGFGHNSSGQAGYPVGQVLGPGKRLSLIFEYAGSGGVKQSFLKGGTQNIAGDC